MDLPRVLAPLIERSRQLLLRDAQYGAEAVVVPSTQRAAAFAGAVDTLLATLIYMTADRAGLDEAKILKMPPHELLRRWDHHGRAAMNDLHTLWPVRRVDVSGVHTYGLLKFYCSADTKPRATLHDLLTDLALVAELVKRPAGWVAQIAVAADFDKFRKRRRLDAVFSALSLHQALHWLRDGRTVSAQVDAIVAAGGDTHDKGHVRDVTAPVAQLLHELVIADPSIDVPGVSPAELQLIATAELVKRRLESLQRSTYDRLRAWMKKP